MVEPRWIWARNRRPVAPTRRGSAERYVLLLCATAQSSTTGTSFGEPGRVVDTKAQKACGLAPGSAQLALVEDDELDVRLAPQGTEGGHPPRSRRERMLKNPRDLVPLQNADDAQSGAHTRVANANALDHVRRVVLDTASPRAITSSHGKPVNARERPARRGQHGPQQLPSSRVLLDVAEDGRTREIKVLAVEALPLTGLKAHAPHGSGHAANAAEEVGDVLAPHARGGGPDGTDRCRRTASKCASAAFM